MMNDAPIGVFDSGVGGLTVAREIMRQLPGESIVYFGDMARVPYGSKSKETVISFSKQIVKFLQEKKVKAIVIACNTASAFALSATELQIVQLSSSQAVASTIAAFVLTAVFSAQLTPASSNIAFNFGSVATSCSP